MVRGTRIVLAAVLAAAFSIGPLMLDLCAGSCETHREGSATPTCHHAGSTTPHVGRAPAACGHDHSGNNGSTVVGSDRNSRVFAMSAAIMTVPIGSGVTAVPGYSRTHAPPGPATAFDQPSITLRV
jgi:hypothetical protein